MGPAFLYYFPKLSFIKILSILSVLKLDQYRKILTEVWGYSKFRPLQEEIIHSVATGNDTLALMPTGGGKSITFQVPGLYLKGICLVVTPLIALMKDQVENLKKRNIKAIAIYSGMSFHEIQVALDNLTFGDYKFMYISPERLASSKFRERLMHMKISMLAIDEAHCISQWGYDFRPSYLQIAEVRKLLPGVPVLALTATATPEVVNDIQERLEFKEKRVFQMSFERKNLIYKVEKETDKYTALVNIFNSTSGSAIVYVRSRNKAREVAEILKLNKLKAEYYHAGLKAETRELVQNQWTRGNCRIIVSTNAFGMGIDKPDVRLVVHLDLPDSPEEYYQEAGRGGRDGKTSLAIILYNPIDESNFLQRITKSFPDREFIKNVYHALGNYLQVPYDTGEGQSFDFDLINFCTTNHLETVSTYNALKILEKEGLLELTEEVNNLSRLMFLIKRDDLYKFQVENAQFDAFIKLLLRSYTGVFQDYVKIDEMALSRKANTSHEQVYEYLKTLSRLKVINYIPQKKSPFLVFTTQRVPNSHITISQENFEWRKNRFSVRIHAMLDYVSSTTRCRSQMLLSYFGEKNTFRCGSCDVCAERNELDLSKYEFDLLLNEIKRILLTEKISVQALTQQIGFPVDKVKRILRWLYDNQKINLSDGDRLSWNQKK